MRIQYKFQFESIAIDEIFIPKFIKLIVLQKLETLFLILLLVEFRHVQTLVNVSWNWLNLGSQFLFNSVQSKPVIIGDQVDRDSKVAESSTTTNPMKVSFCHFWEVEINDDVDCLDIDTTGEKIAANKVPAESGAEIMEDSVSVSLRHFGVNVVAGISQLSNLFGQQLDSLGRVAENYTLVDLKFGEQCIQTVNLLSFLNKCVVLGDALQC